MALIKRIIMETAINNPSVLESYWNEIKNWSDEMKLTLISKLSSSMEKKKKKVSKAKTDSWDGVFGIMKDDYFPSAKELEEIMSDTDKDYEKLFL